MVWYRKVSYGIVWYISSESKKFQEKFATSHAWEVIVNIACGRNTDYHIPYVNREYSVVKFVFINSFVFVWCMLSCMICGMIEFQCPVYDVEFLHSRVCFKLFFASERRCRFSGFELYSPMSPFVPKTQSTICKSEQLTLCDRNINDPTKFCSAGENEILNRQKNQKMCLKY